MRFRVEVPWEPLVSRSMRDVQRIEDDLQRTVPDLTVITLNGMTTVVYGELADDNDAGRRALTNLVTFIRQGAP